MAVFLRRSVLYRAFNLNKPLQLSCANISTTKKNKEVPSTTISDTGVSKPPVTVADFADTKPRYWMSYGYSETDYTMDRDYHHLVMFFGITFMLGLGFIMMYIPDFRDLDWTEREAYLRLERRERLGLPKIDRNLVDPSRLTLPSEEELEGVEIIL
ncbi:unnamed protein product [Ixodes persulcatus]